MGWFGVCGFECWIYNPEVLCVLGVCLINNRADLGQSPWESMLCFFCADDLFPIGPGTTPSSTDNASSEPYLHRLFFASLL